MKLTLLDYVVLIVDDLDRALGFYTEVLGLRIGHRSGDFAQLDTREPPASASTREKLW